MTSMKISLALLFSACSLLVFQQGAIAEIICEEMPINVCAFSISSSGKRCLLENAFTKDGKEFQCKTSEVMVGRNTAEYIETEKCMNACGVDRNTVGMSSDSFLEPKFAAKLCSTACYHNCPNIVDLYFNLAAGEGVYLPDFCKKQRNSLRRDMVEFIKSSGDVALDPISRDSRRSMVELDDALAPSGQVSSDNVVPGYSHRSMVELDDSDALAPFFSGEDAPALLGSFFGGEDVPVYSHRSMVELDDSDALAPSSSFFGDENAPEYSRRSMFELNGSDGLETFYIGEDAPAPIFSDEDAFVPSPSLYL